MNHRLPTLLCLILILAVPALAREGRPRVLLLATGGTIAGTATAGGATTYQAGTLSADSLVRAVPGLGDLAELGTEQISNIGSQDMSDEVWLKLARRIEQAFARDEADSVVITHGTDTLEETAFFLEQVLSTDRPVVLVGAMRPATGLSADGPANLYQAVQVATDPNAGGWGVMVVLNDLVFKPRYLTKTHTTALQAFQAPLTGPVGSLDSGNLRFLGPRPTLPPSPLPLPDRAPLPRVDILYSHAGMTAAPIREAVAGGARGLVLAGVGNGNTSRAALEALAQAARQGIPVVRSSRVGAGPTLRNAEVDDDRLGLAASLDLNPAKARILLQLLLSAGVRDIGQVQEAFQLR